MAHENPTTAPERTADRDGSPADDRRTAPSETSAAKLCGTELVIGYRGTDAPVVDGETVAVPPDGVTALIGPNGSGKSTLLKGLANKIAPDDGVVLLDGDAVEGLGSKELARKLGLLSQQNVAPDGISVADLVERGRYPHSGFFESSTEADRRAVDDAIRMAGVEHLRDRDVGSLSGGQKQLVWIAMALAQETDVLLLDEPTTFLDPHHQLEVMQVVETLRDESDTTVVLVLHDISQAARYANHVIALKNGSVYSRGQPESVITARLLADVFEIEAEVVETEHGPQIIPLDPLHEGESG